MQGFFNIDKPLGITSHDVVNRIRRVVGMKRVGHAGTLDPLANGVLIVAIGRTTRLIEYVMGQHKTYQATVRLGQTTTTYDAEGEITSERPVPILTPALLEETLAPFRGEIDQIPPIYSAIKQNGQPIYKLARRGIAVELQPRRVTIDRLALIGVDGVDVTLQIDCSTGTYIRSLAYDWGEALRCGGHLIALRRTYIGAFSADTAVRLDQLTPENVQNYLLPPDVGVAHLPRLDVTPESASILIQGKKLPINEEDPSAETIVAYADQHLLGILTRQSDHWQPHKLFL